MSLRVLLIAILFFSHCKSPEKAFAKDDIDLVLSQFISRLDSNLYLNGNTNFNENTKLHIYSMTNIEDIFEEDLDFGRYCFAKENASSSILKDLDRVENVHLTNVHPSDVRRNYYNDDGVHIAFSSLYDAVKVKDCKCLIVEYNFEHNQYCELYHVDIHQQQVRFTLKNSFLSKF